MYLLVDTTAYDSYCSQRVPSGDMINPVVQAQVFSLPGLGRQRWAQPPLLELQALVVPAESVGGKGKKVEEVSLTCALMEFCSD